MHIFQMCWLIILALCPSIVFSEELTTAIDHMQLIFHDVFNGSYLASKGYKGSVENTNVIPGKLFEILTT
jgi:hypothetical protein